jgi:hypothetical protein
MAGVYNSLVAGLFPEMNLQGSSSADKLLDFWSIIKEKSSYLINELSDDTKEMITWEGKSYLKNGVAFTTVQEMYIKDTEAAFSSIMNIFTQEQQMDRMIQQAI